MKIKAYTVYNSSKIPSQSVFVDIFPKKIIFCCNHDFGGCATIYKTQGVP